MSSNWLNRVKPGHHDATRKRVRRPKTFPARLELLEERLVLAVINWDGDGGDLSWNNPLNWSTDTLPKSERTFSRFFRADVFRSPARGTIGNAATTLFRGPGVNNFDIAIFKDFPIHEAVKFQFRAEMYNAFNHTQFNSVDNGARFDPQGNQVNTRLGEMTGTTPPRRIQLALRFYF
jgi:hypothetical protein